jgi:hypothetical protein
MALSQLNGVPWWNRTWPPAGTAPVGARLPEAVRRWASSICNGLVWFWGQGGSVDAALALLSISAPPYFLIYHMLGLRVLTCT